MGKGRADAVVRGNDLVYDGGVIGFAVNLGHDTPGTEAAKPPRNLGALGHFRSQIAQQPVKVLDDRTQIV